MTEATPNRLNPRLRADLLRDPPSEESFARLALAKRYVTEDQLQACRREQGRLRTEGRDAQLDQLLLKEGFQDSSVE